MVLSSGVLFSWWVYFSVVLWIESAPCPWYSSGYPPGVTLISKLGIYSSVSSNFYNILDCSLTALVVFSFVKCFLAESYQLP